jgi:hypothetical protein
MTGHGTDQEDLKPLPTLHPLENRGSELLVELDFAPNLAPCSRIL